MLMRSNIPVASNLRRLLLHNARRTLLSQRFALDDEWLRRYDGLSALGITGSYEWITAVQKKFVSVGIASAVDVDAAVCVASEGDQVDDVVRIIYRLRHTNKTGDTSASTEYALLRLLLKHHKDNAILSLLNDPINYGVFLNKHAACLIIDYFLKKDRIPEAMKVASTVMLQELFDSKLLNLLCVYCALKWIELPLEERILDELPNLRENGDSAGASGEDEERVFKFPYLKNITSDGHFDLVDPNHLVGKSLLWFADYLQLEGQFAENIRLIGSIYLSDMNRAKNLLKSSCKPYDSTLKHCLLRIKQVLGSSEEKERRLEKDMLEAKVLLENSDQIELQAKLSETIEQLIMQEREVEEEKIMQAQIAEFKAWRDRRMELVQAQAERMELTLRLVDVREQQTKLHEEWEVLNFFEHRERWEDIARTKNELLKSEKSKSKSREELEQEYVEKMFTNRNVMSQNRG